MAKAPHNRSALVQAMARFRNLLVHGYADVDDRRAHQFLKNDVADLAGFAAVLLAVFPELGREDS